jgi:hypothetical protein
MRIIDPFSYAVKVEDLGRKVVRSRVEGIEDDK